MSRIFIINTVLLAVNHDLVEMALPPSDERFYVGEQSFAQVRDSVFHVRGHVCKELAVDDAVGRKLFEDLRQHFFRDKWDVAVELVETYRLILRNLQENGQSPLVPNPFEYGSGLAKSIV